MKGQKISVIIPAYNEEENIGEVIKRLSELQLNLPDLEIIIVDDGSKDNTLKEAAKFPNVKCVGHNKNLGKGAAIRSGIEKSTGDVIVIQDADLEYFPDEIPKIVKPILAGVADVVFGSRLFNGVPFGMRLSHYIGNKILSLVTTIMYGVRVTDVMTGHKALTREVFNSFKLKDDGFAVEIEIAVNTFRNGWRFLEAPVAYRYRQRGASKIRFIDGFKCLWEIVKGEFESFI